MVDDPASTLLDVVVAPGDPDVRVAAWRQCPTTDCPSPRVALAISRGTGTRVVPSRVWRSTPLVRVDAEGRALVVSWEERLGLAVVRPDGSVVDVRRTRDVAPVAPGEIVAGVVHGRGGASFLATDPVRAVAHPIPVPRDSVQVEQLPSGQLRATTLRRTYAWSDDGGATWHESAGASAATLLQSFATSTPDRHVLVGGSDGATLFPFEEVRTMDSVDSWSVVPQPAGPRAYVGATAVLPDGRFLVDVEGWSDNGRTGGRLRGTAPGLYVSDGSDWAAYSRLEQGTPFAEAAFGVPDVRYAAVDDGSTTLGAIGPDGRSWWTSTDLGGSWEAQPVR
ncbi:hypothetical protein ASG88_06500 [Nocardioides sp. Soil777]|nr:hypothetical protein ASG88_06500 [Nocardioides sp. Soil777]